MENDKRQHPVLLLSPSPNLEHMHTEWCMVNIGGIAVSQQLLKVYGHTPSLSCWLNLSLANNFSYQSPMHMHAQLGRACMYFLKGEKEKPLAVACLKGKLKDWVLKINMLHPSFPQHYVSERVGRPPYTLHC